MTKLEKLKKEYIKTFYDLVKEEDSSEIRQSLIDKIYKLEDEITQEQIRIARRKRK